MNDLQKPEKFKVIVIGGGQAGLSVGYYLKKYNIPFVILDASEKIGDSWRKRWDSLLLFTPSHHDGLPGLAVPGARSTIVRRCGAYTAMVAGSVSCGGMRYSVHVRLSRYHSPGASNSSCMPRT